MLVKICKPFYVMCNNCLIESSVNESATMAKQLNHCRTNLEDALMDGLVCL